MEIILADKAGFCFGVKRAYDETDKLLDEKKEVYIRGDLVHNPSVVKYMEDRGLKKYEKDLPKNSTVIVRSHGEVKSHKENLADKSNQIVDLTCPVLMKIYDKIIGKFDQGYKIFIVGDPNHPEVKAMNSYVNDEAVILQDEDSAKNYRGLDKIYLISQTTNRKDFFTKIASIIEGNNTNVIAENTICSATRLRQEACVELAKKVDLMVVIGGKKSSNTDKLFKLAKEIAPAVKIETYKELDFIGISQYNIIGITAGASTPDWIIEEVIYFMDNYSKDEFMEQIEDSMTKIYPKEIVKGEVIYVTDDEVVVNINYKSDGIVSLNELSNEEGVKPKDLFEEGQEIDVYVIKLDDGEGNVVLSTRRVEGLKNWNGIVESYENEEPIVVNVTKEVKGGLLGNYKGIVAFIPGSQIKTFYVKDLSQFVGQDLECKILSVDEKKRRIVASSRVIEEENKEKEINEFWDTFQEGDVIKGKVARLVDFGAFINLGPMDGLVHISDISWNRIKHPSDVLEVGQEIEAVVLKKDDEDKQVSLGYKQLQDKPFDRFLANNKAGDAVDGKVVNLVDFGAFVRLDEGVEGLVHVSEISHSHVEKPSDELEIDQDIKVKILSIEPEEKRIALSIKALEEKPQEEVSEENKPVFKEKKRKPRPKQQRKSEPAVEESSEGLETSLGSIFDFSGLETEGSNEAAESQEEASNEETTEE